MSKTALTLKQKLFADEYLIDLNATAAYKRAGYAGSGNGAEVNAHKLLRSTKVAEYIQSSMKKREERTEVTQDRVLAEWWNMLTADMNDLVEYRRGCCRYCYGDDHRFQRTQAEYLRDSSATEDGIDSNVDGGVGFNPRKPPHPDCPECFGDGHGRAIIKDTRTLPAAVRSIYAGVKQTKDGVQVLTHSKDKALEMVGRHLGMFSDNLNLNVNDKKSIDEVRARIADLERKRAAKK